MVSQAFVHIAVSSQESGAFLSITHARDFLLPFSRIVKSPLRRRQHNIRAFRETRVGEKAQANERRSYVTIKNALIPNFADRRFMLSDKRPASDYPRLYKARGIITTLTYLLVHMLRGKQRRFRRTHHHIIKKSQ